MLSIGNRTARLAALCLITSCLGIAGCSEKEPSSPPVLDSGITAANGGGQRALGNLPDVSVSNGKATETLQPRDPRVPRY